MPKITDIAPQKRNSNLYSVFVDGKFRLSLSDLDLSNADIHIGQEISLEEIKILEERYLFAKAYNRSLDYLSRRARSIKEMKDYLLKKGYSIEIIDRIIEKLVDQRYLDDEQFAVMWVRDRNAIKPRSLKQLQAELYKKGIEKESMEHVLEEQKNQELDNAVKLLVKKMKNPKNVDKQKQIAYLARLGFSYSVIRSAVDLAACEDQS